MTNESSLPTNVGSNDGLGVSWKSEHAPTHRCKVCGAMWRLWLRQETPHATGDSWNLRSAACGKCCDNEPMGDQIEPLRIGDLMHWLSARLDAQKPAPHVKTAAEMRMDAAHDTSCVGAFARARPGA